MVFFRPSPAVLAVPLLLIVMLVGPTGCSPGAIESPSENIDFEPSSTRDDAGDLQPIAVPDGPPEELFAFIDSLDDQLDLPAETSAPAAAGESPASRGTVDAIRRVMEARIAACDKILSRQIPEETQLRAVGVRLDALRTLAALDPESATERFDKFTQRLVASGDPLMSRMAKGTRFQVDMHRALSTSGPTKDEILAKLQTLLEDPAAGPETLDATSQAAGWLLQYGHLETAIQAFRSIGQRFQTHPDSTVADRGKSLITQAQNLELALLARRTIDDEANALQELMSQIEESLSATTAGTSALASALESAQALEYAGQYEEAIAVYRLIERAYQGEPGSEIARDLSRSIELAERRLALIGTPVTIEGVAFGGRPFDWERYRDKWVLVCFWTTWHQGWLAEVDNIHDVVGQYHDPMVEVVSINLDDDRNQLERFVKEHPTYWPVLVNPDPAALGFENPNAVRCGVEAVPFMMLVDPTGTVVDIHVMGKRLAAALAEHMGP